VVAPVRLPQGDDFRTFLADFVSNLPQLVPMIGKAIREPASALLAPADVLRDRRICNALRNMKTLTVRLPEPLLADIEAESRGRKISKSDVVRERLQLAPRKRRRNTSLNTIADLIASRNQLEKRLA